MEDSKLLIDILERLTKIETILATQNYKVVEQAANEALIKSKKNEKEINDIKSTIKWVVVTIIGAIILAIVKILVNYSWR